MCVQSVSALNDPRFFYHVNERVTRKMILQEKLITENMDANNQPEKLSLRPSLFRMLQDALQVKHLALRNLCWKCLYSMSVIITYDLKFVLYLSLKTKHYFCSAC